MHVFIRRLSLVEWLRAIRLTTADRPATVGVAHRALGAWVSFFEVEYNMNILATLRSLSFEEKATVLGIVGAAVFIWAWLQFGFIAGLFLTGIALCFFYRYALTDAGQNTKEVPVPGVAGRVSGDSPVGRFAGLGVFGGTESWRH